MPSRQRCRRTSLHSLNSWRRRSRKRGEFFERRKAKMDPSAERRCPGGKSPGITTAEIIADGVVHAIGVCLGIVGAVTIVVMAVRGRTNRRGAHLLPACHVRPSRFQRRRLPFPPTINSGTSNPNRFISRSHKRDRGGIASRIRNHDGPLLAAGARKNEKLNTLVVHGTRHYHV
jgi:hypothetical protein